MRSIFRYPGGKTKRQIQDWILSYRPKGMKEYREPFVGGGGIYFAVSPDIPRWINDKHPGLVAVYEALRDRPEQFIAKCKSIEPPSEDDELSESGVRGGGRYNKRLKELFDEVKLNEHCDQAFRYFYVNRTVFGGRVNYDIPSRLYFSNPAGWNIVENGQLEKAAKHIAGTKITCGDYRTLFEAPGDDVWIYADPPYYVNTNLTRTSQVYQHGFTREQHVEFAEVVKNCEHKVCVSYDDDEDGFIRSLYQDSQFQVVEASWLYCGTTNEKKDVGRELLILNYEPDIGQLSLFAPEAYQQDTELDDDEREELEECEQVLEWCRDTFLWMGRALRRIRDSGRPSERLYRKTHQTFEDYCRDRWGMSKSQANYLIQSANTCEAIEMTSTLVILPTSQRQCTELSRLPEDKVAEVWESVVQDTETTGEPITAKRIREHVNQAIGYEPPPKPTAFDNLVKWWQKASDEERQRFRSQVLESQAEGCAA